MSESASTASLIRLEGIEKVYRTEEVRTYALRDVSLDVGQGDFITLVGPSGSGKSTLLSVLGLITGADAGDYAFEGRSVGALSDREKSRLRAEKIGFIFQSFHLVDVLTVAQNVALAMKYVESDRGRIRQRVEETLEQLGVAHRAKHYPSQLSGGQQQRVAIARAIANRPSLLLADEPTGNLDEKTGEEVMTVLSDLHAAGMTLVVVTHSKDIAARGQRQIEIHDGMVRSNG